MALLLCHVLHTLLRLTPLRIAPSCGRRAIGGAVLRVAEPALERVLGEVLRTAVGRPRPLFASGFDTVSAAAANLGRAEVKLDFGFDFSRPPSSSRPAHEGRGVREGIFLWRRGLRLSRVGTGGMWSGWHWDLLNFGLPFEERDRNLSYEDIPGS